MTLYTLRLEPGRDLRRTLETASAGLDGPAAFVLQGIGSLSEAAIRFAGREAAESLHGDFEILTLAGSLSPDGAHLHISVADAAGHVVGGHVAPGCIVRTTAEILIAASIGEHYARRVDPATGYPELVVTRRTSS